MLNYEHIVYETVYILTIHTCMYKIKSFPLPIQGDYKNVHHHSQYKYM